MNRRSRRSCRPEVARLETRDVPTVVSPLAFGGAGLAAQRADAEGLAKVSGIAAPAVSPSQGPTVSTPSTNTPNGLNFSPNAPLDPTTLTPLGLRASRFSILVDSPYANARSFYNDAARQVIYIGNARGTTNQILHGTLLMRVVIPTDPSATIYGIAVIRDLANATTGTQLVLDLTSTAKDPLGRPTAFTWNVDSTSGGSYAGAPGQGTLSIAYTAGHPRTNNAAGGAILVFKGMILPDPTLLNTLYDIPRFG